jgi:hypothetical protein
MRKKLLIALAVVAGILLILVGVIAMQPADYSVTRSGTINAPKPLVYGLVNNFQNWEGWSPWAKLDPAAKNSFEGPASGTGAVFKWSGNDEVGEGKMTITDAQPTDLIKIKLDFVRPFEDTCNVEFAFKTQGEQTTVSWTMYGHKGFFSKAICMFMDMDKMLGGDFEKGLASMKKLAEGGPTTAPATQSATQPAIKPEN